MITIPSLNSLQVSLIAVLLLAGLVSATVYWRQRRKLDAILVLAAVLPIALVLLQPHIKANSTLSTRKTPETYLLDSRHKLPPMSELRKKIQQAETISLRGDGLFRSQWQDLPVRPVIRLADSEAKQEASERLELKFPQPLAYGRVFTLEVGRPQASVQTAWRIQLLAENQQVLAEQKGSGKALTLSWLPPVAERMVLQAKIWDAQDKLIDQGPIPLEVINTPPLQVQGRFAAPSFDTQSLNQLLLQSHAILDWQTQLGKGIMRKERSEESSEESSEHALDTKALFVQDAAYFEQLAPAARQQLLTQVAQGASLIVLGANAQQASIWSKQLGLPLRKVNTDTEKIRSAQGVNLSAVNWTPALTNNADWQAVDAQDWLVQRSWQRGRIVWLAAADWHQAMISEPQKLKLWWQSILDASAVQQVQDWTMEIGDGGDNAGMPLLGQALQLCARGLDQRELALQGVHQPLVLRPVANKAEAQCAAFWPNHSGWYDWQILPQKIASGAVQTQTQTQASAAFYVFSESDWASWQRQQKHRATAAYVNLLPEKTSARLTSLPLWPFVLFSMAASLMLWRREQRAG